MSLCALRMLRHEEVEDGDDESLRREARSHLTRHPALQLVAELIGKLRTLELPWWTPEFTREAWPAVHRMRWFKQRPDLRQVITTKLTGLPPKAARRFWPDEQAALIDAVIDNGDVETVAFEESFDGMDLVVYGPANEFWRVFRERMPWEDDSPVHQRLAAWLLRALSSERASADGVARRPILSALDIRSAIDSAVWQEKIPFQVRVEVDQARLKHERLRPREPFGARHELAIVTPERIAANLSLADLSLLIERAEGAMGYGGEEVEATPSSPESIEAPRPSQIN
ncbi:MAG: hypothetical protein U0414_03770 [Polyangiaceae bacterium]